MAVIDDRNGQRTTVDYDRLDNLLESYNKSSIKLDQAQKQVESLSRMKSDLAADLLETRRKMKEIAESYSDMFQANKDQAYLELKEYEEILEGRRKLNDQILQNAKRAEIKAESAVKVLNAELQDVAERSSVDIDALIRQARGEDGRNKPLEKLKNKLAELELAKENLTAEIEEMSISLMDESLSESAKNDIKQTLRERQEELRQKQLEIIDQTYDINAAENFIRRAKGEHDGAIENRIETMFGRDLGRSLNYLGGRFSGIGNILDIISGQSTGSISDLSGLLFEAAQEAERKGERYDSADALLDAAEYVVEGVAPEFVPIVEGLKATRAVLDVISGVVSAMNTRMGQYIDSAAAAIKSYYGTINANLYGYSDYQTMADQADILGGSNLVRQTDYLSQIASLSADGVARDIEAAAILQTIKDRTLTQFNSSNEALRRLVRLGQDQVYQSQFGLELQLKKVLNSTFKDSGYLSGLFDSVRDTIMDAAVNQTGDITAFNSTVQTWLGAMYSSGLSSNVVNQIANGINALGSGNISALASDESTQRLFLLAMDRVGLDYADILQQGLSLNDTNTLLQSVVQYLGEIAGNTSDNLVLKSSYANLFNLTTTDLKAIQNLNQSMPAISSMIVDTSNAVTMTQYAASSMLEANTSVAEKWDNFFDNFQYAIGSNVSESNALYSTWRIASLLNNLVSPITNNQTLSKVPVLGTAAKAAQIASGLTQFGIGVESLISAIPEAAGAITEGQGSAVASLLNLSGANASSTLSSSTSPYSRTALKSSSMFTKMSASVDTAAQQAAEYQEDIDTGKILEEIEKALRKQKEHYAFAVYLEGMTDETLKSFASIFADEDAMLQTFKGKNNTLEDNLFTYLDDNSKNKNSNTKQA